MFLKDIESHQTTKFRIAEIAGAVILGFLAIILGIAEIKALFTGSKSLFGLGILFVDSLGILAFIIPLYFFYAAFLLAHPAYRPDRIFILNCSLFPFLTLAIGFVFVRDFDAWSEQLIFLSWIGKGGVNFFIILLTVIEGIIIGAFTSLLFSGVYKKEEYRHDEYAKKFFSRPPGSSQRQDSAKMFKFPWYFLSRRLKISSRLLPPPILKQSSLGASPAEEDYAAYDDRILEEFNEEEIDIENLRLPDIKPLASLTALGTLESLSHKQGRNRGYQFINNEGAIIEPVEQALDADAPFRKVQGSPNNRENRRFHGMEHKTGGYEGFPESKYPKSSWMPYRIPVEGLLNQYPEVHEWIIDQAAKDAALILKETLAEFNIQAELKGIKKGPVLTLFEILPAAEAKFPKIVNLQDNIALRLASSSVRISAPMPGKPGVVGIEVPNTKQYIVSFAEIIEEELLRRLAPGAKKLELPMVLGRNIIGEPQIMDLVQMSHLLIAGAKDSGKSVCVNSLILSILYRRPPAECRLILIDPKTMALKRYNDIPHLLTPVITEPKGAFQAIRYCIFEMERRYACLNSLGVRDIRMYNKRIRERGIGVEHLPYIVVAIDEFEGLMAFAGKKLESSLTRLAAMSRAVGIHLVLTTQRPSIDVITGRIKANIPSRIAFMAASKTDGRIIMDMAGVEKLLGRGDMLYAGTENPVPIRMQGAFVSEEEVERVVDYVKTLGDPDYIDDELFNDDEMEHWGQGFSRRDQ